MYELRVMSYLLYESFKLLNFPETRGKHFLQSPSLSPLNFSSENCPNWPLNLNASLVFHAKLVGVNIVTTRIATW